MHGLRVVLLPEEEDDNRPRRKRVIRGYQAQSQQLAAALAAVMTRSVVEATSVVIEGVHLLPGLLPKINPRDATLVHIILVVSDEGAHRHYFELRDKQTGQRRKGQRYLDHFEEIRIIHDFMLERAKAEGVGIIDTLEFNHTVEEEHEHVLKESLEPRQHTALTVQKA